MNTRHTSTADNNFLDNPKFNEEIIAGGGRFSSILKLITAAFSHKQAALVIMLVVMIAKFLQFAFLLDTRDDISHQVMASQNLYNGYGVSVPVIQASDLATVHYHHQVKWPPGYSIIFLPFYALFQQNYLAAVFFLYLLSAFLLLVTCRSILKLFDTGTAIMNLFTLIAGFSIFYFQLKPSSDAFAALFYLVALYYAFWILKHNRKYSIHFLGITAALLLSASCKYLYIPIVFILPFFLFLTGCINKNAALKKAAGLSFLVLALVIGGLLAWQKYSQGNFAYIQQTARGLYPENLARFHSFIPATLVKPESLYLLWPSGFFQSILFQRLLQLLHVSGLAALGIYIFLQERKNAFKTSFSANRLLLISFLIGLGVTVMLGVLSLFVKEETWDNGQTWTYIQEPRYYALVHVLLLLSVFVLYSKAGKNRIKKASVFLFIIIICLLPETFRGAIFAANRLRNFSSEEYSWQNELKFQEYTAALIEQQKNEKGIDRIVLSGSSDWMNWRASLYTKYPIFTEMLKVNQLSSIQSSKPVILFFILRDSEIPLLQPFIISGERFKVGRYKNFEYYSIPVYPGKPVLSIPAQ